MKFTALLLGFTMLVALGCNNESPKNNPEKEVAKVVEPEKAKVAATVDLPTFNMIDLQKKPFALNDFKGKKVLVNLWATWCPPCRAEIPSLEKLYSKIDKNKVSFVLLSLDDNLEVAAEYAQKNKLSIPAFYPAQDLPKLFTVQSIPTTFIFDEKGTLIKSITGMENYDTQEFLDLFSK
ncbi:MAG: TlpA family protein disulfide reductase [Ferruginibacter sp.]